MTDTQILNAINTQFTITGREFALLMRRHRVTIRQLKERTGIPMYRIRQMREFGVRGYVACDMHEAIAGNLSPRMRACFLARKQASDRA